MDTQLERKMRELVDRSEIWQLMQRYGRGLDRLDVQLTRSCYWDDAIEDHGLYVGGPDGFIEWANGTTLAFVTSQHGLLNHSCELDGDNAWCETYYIFSGTLPQPPHFMSTGRYIDHFQKRNDEWRIANRVTIIEATYDLNPSDMGKGLPSAYGPDEAYPGTRDTNDASYRRPLVPRKAR